MSVTTTRTLTVTIDAPLAAVASDLADPAAHPEWATEFFAGPAVPQPDGSVLVPVPMMGGTVGFRIEADVERGIVDLFLAPAGAPFGGPIPVRLIPNGDGVDVLWTLGRPAGVPDEAWEGGLTSMQRELDNLRRRHES